jgi:transcription elongation factor Elf1
LRNNLDRMGVEPTEVAAQSPAPAFQQANLMDFVVPTSYVELPSEGKFYPVNHPLHGQTHIEIKHMTAKEEDILTSQSLLKKGVALEKLISSVVIDKSIRPETLLTCDRSAIMVAARVTGYGADYTTKINCPSCNKQSSVTVDLEAIEPKHELEVENIKKTVNNTFLVPTPSGFMFELRLLNGVDEKAITENNENKKRKNLPESNNTDLLKIITVSINEVTDRQVIEKVISDALPAKDSKFIKAVYSKIVPAIEIKTLFTCSSCDFEQELEVPLTTEFFWPK